MLYGTPDYDVIGKGCVSLYRRESRRFPAVAGFFQGSLLLHFTLKQWTPQDLACIFWHGNLYVESGIDEINGGEAKGRLGPYRLLPNSVVQVSRVTLEVDKPHPKGQFVQKSPRMKFLLSIKKTDRAETRNELATQVV